MQKKIVMLGTAFETRGGISAVVNVYREHGLLRRWPIVYLPTHCDGGALDKISIVTKSLIEFLGLLLSGQIAAVHVHSASRVSFWRKSLFIFPAFAVSCPVIFHLHGGGFVRFYEWECGNLGKRLIRFVLNKSDRVIVLSSQWKKWLCGISNNKNIICIFNPVFSELLEPTIKKNQTLLFLGRLEKEKGIFDLLEVMARLTNQFPNLQLLCGGTGEMTAVKAQIERLGLGNRVNLLGWVTGSKKQESLAEASIYILPSYREGLPMSILEAMAVGLPVVTTPVGGIADAVTDRVHGLFFQPGDLEGMQSALTILLQDKLLREKMGKAAREKAMNLFSADQVVPQIEELYRNLGIMPVCESVV